MKWVMWYLAVGAMVAAVAWSSFYLPEPRKRRRFTGREHAAGAAIVTLLWPVYLAAWVVERVL